MLQLAKAFLEYGNVECISANLSLLSYKSSSKVQAKVDYNEKKKVPEISGIFWKFSAYITSYDAQFGCTAALFC